MSDDFIPRLGRPGNRGSGAAKRYTARVKRAAKRLGKRKPRTGFTGERISRGSAAARMMQMRAAPFEKFRMRRVIVKVHIARASQGGGKSAYRAHLKYLQRDGVARVETGRDPSPEMIAGEEGDRGAGRLYDRTRENVDDAGFLECSADDRHQFRIIVSPEDADQLGDLKEMTRSLMAQVEKDLDTRLDWVAVDHDNTGHPHTHIVVRGRDRHGRDLVIARNYLTKGLRQRAQGIVMEWLGPRRDLEIARAQSNEVRQERWTGIDRRLSDIAREGVVAIESARGGVRFERTLRLRRLGVLEGMGLARPMGSRNWRMTEGWQDRLKELGRRGDIIRTLSAAAGRELKDRNVVVFEGRAEQGSVLGRVIANAPADELRDMRAIGVEALDGKVWHVQTGQYPAGALLPVGAIVEVSASRAQPKQADRTIVQIAAIHGGRYSPDLHRQDDPAASASYIEAHKRRLEALRRAGLVEREADGAWRIGKNYLTRAGAHEARRGGAAKIEVKSWIDIDAQTTAPAPVWLDDAIASGAEEMGADPAGFGAELAAAKHKRMAFLKREGLWSDDHRGIDPAKRATLTQKLLKDAASAEAARSGRAYVDLLDGASFAGVYEKPMTLASGRFALIARSKEFALVPWRADLERRRGRAITLKRGAKGVSWTFGKSKGISR